MTNRARKEGDLALYIDLRSIGSNGSIYSDESLPATERATRLLRDFIEALHDGLYEAVTAPASNIDLQHYKTT